MGGEKRPEKDSLGTIRALKEAVRHTDISLFGPLYDHHLAISHLENPNLTIREHEQEAFKATMEEPSMRRVGIEPVIEALEEKKYGTVYFSDRSQNFLDRYAKQAKDRALSGPQLGQKINPSPQNSK
jgi:hypothetical protein